MTPKPNGKRPNARSCRTQTGKPGHRRRVEQARLAERRHEALKLHLAGLTRRAIAKHLGISLQRAHNDVVVALAELASARRADGELRIQLEGARLDQLQVYAWQQAQRGDVRAILAVCRIIEQRCRLLGLNAPQQLKVSAESDARPFAAVERVEIERRLVALAMKDPAMRAALAAKLASGGAIASRTSSEDRGSE